jgi:hypothetical protein
MNRFLDIALAHAALGLYVFPVARDKGTLTPHGYKDASVDPEKIRTWWAQMPSANPGFAPGASDVAVLDIDHGLTDMASFIAWRDRNGIPATYTVRSGSRPEFKVHMYFKGAMRDVGTWELDGCSGQVKSLGGYVLAAGSEALHGEKHDKPGAPYEVIDGTLGVFADTPDVVSQLRKPVAEKTNNSKVPKTRWDLPVHEGEDRTGFLMEQTGAMRNLGCGKDAIFARMVELNEDPEIIADPVDSERLERTAENCAKYPVPEPVGEVVFGSKPKSEAKNGIWLSDENSAHLFATREELETAKPLSFFIDGFLPDDGVTAIAAPVCQRKSLIAQNMTRSLVTGLPLFGHFKVVRRPTRVLYLVPEVTRCSLKQRLEGLGLMEYVGRTLFCRTLNEEGKLWLTDPALRPHLPGSVVFLDTAIRFMKGNENESQDMQVFSEEIFGLLRDGAASVVMLHHSRKTGKDAGELTLDAALRGSGELGAFLTTCWATKLNGDDEYKAPSILKNVKQRDIQTKPFEVTSNRQTGILTMVEGSLGNATCTKTQNRGNKDGKDEARLDFLKKNRHLSDREAAALLKKLKMGRSHQWVHDRREEMELETKGITYNTGGLTVETNA